MKRFEKLLTNINFKKVLIIYLISAIIAGIASVSFLSYVFRDKIGLMIDYKKVSERLEHNTDLAVIQSDLTSFADNNSDVVDVVILNEDNRILFSAKNSVVAKTGSLNLERDSQWKHEYKFMFDPVNSEVVYRLIKGESSLQSLKSVIKGNDYNEEHDGEYFFGVNSAKTVYSLSYMRGENSNSKTYFIFDFSPVQKGVISIKVVAASAILFFMLYWVLLALYVYADAVKSKLNATAWGILLLFTNLGGLVIYKIYKQSGKTCFKCKALQDKNNLYCTVCGTKIGNTCIKCGTLLNSHDRYCRMCGEDKKED